VKPDYRYVEVYARAAGFAEPLFWDTNGVPHFKKKEMERLPQHLFGTIYCQNCMKPFRVFLADMIYKNGGCIRRDIHKKPDYENYTHLRLARQWHYGDPPLHGCVGDSMNCYDEWELAK
jgi:hypothetical protein